MSIVQEWSPAGAGYQERAYYSYAMKIAVCNYILREQLARTVSLVPTVCGSKQKHLGTKLPE